MDWLVGVAAFAVFVLVAVAAWYFWWLFPKRQVETFRPTITDPKDRADVENNFRSTISQVLGGAAVIAGAALGVWQFLLQ